MIFHTFSLFDLIKEGNKKEDLMKILSRFSCPLNSNVEKFIKNKAYDFERIGLSRTYLITYRPKGGKSKLIAVFVLGMSNVEINEKFTRLDRKELFGTTYPLGKNVKTLLVGQLAKNYAEGNDKYISGDLLMKYVFYKIKEVHRMFPSVVTHIDCDNHPKLRKYYERNGFRLFKRLDNRLVYLFPTNNIYEEVVRNQSS